MGEKGGSGLKVRYYRLPSGRNEGFAVVFGEWPKGSLRTRGYSAKRMVYSREATPEEIADVKNLSRFCCVLYKTAESLIGDEISILSTEELEKLKSAVAR